MPPVPPLTDEQKNEIIKTLLTEQIAEAEKALAILAAQAQQKMDYLQQLQVAAQQTAADLNHMSGRMDQSRETIDLLKDKLAALDAPPAAPDTPTDTPTPETLSEA